MRDVAGVHAVWLDTPQQCVKSCSRSAQAFLGDTTWAQLFPSQWAWSRPYPCFNVRDLHTVDDGVWQHLLPALRQDGLAAGAAGNSTGAGSWGGLLVAHYLGVDHCGHTYGVSSEEMAAKLW